MSKSARRQRTAETLAVLAGRFPLTFAIEGDCRPLKIGIDRDIASALTDISQRMLKDALRFYVGSPRYQQTLVHGAERVDLAGATAGIVSADHEAKAKASIALMMERRNNQTSVAMRATKLRRLPAETARAADKPPIARAPAAPASTRPKLTLDGLREAAKRRKAGPR